MKKLVLTDIEDLAALVQAQIEEVSRTSAETIRIGIPGGRSAAFLIEGMLRLPDAILSRVHLYLLDERLSGERNLDTLLASGLAQAMEAGRFKKGSLSIPEVGKPLLEEKATRFDLIYLGVGEDGHIASLFPGSYPSEEKSQTALVLDSPKPPLERVTFTYAGFRTSARTTPIYLLFLGEGKRPAYLRFLSKKEEAESLPCAFFTQENFSVTIITNLKEQPR